MPQQNYWTDPRGQQRQYATPDPTNLSDRMRRSLEREQVWSGVDPSYDSQKFDVLPSGRIQKEDGISPLLIASVIGAPLAGAFLPAMFGAGGAAGTGAAAGAGGATAGAAGGAAAGAGTAAAAGGLSGALKGLLTNPSNLMDLGGLITALMAGSRGGGGQASPETQRMSQLTEDRFRRVDPLHQAVTQLAWGRLPTNARQGIAPPTYKPLS